MPTHGSVWGVLDSFEPEKESPEKGYPFLGYSREGERRHISYRRMKPDALQLHVGSPTSFHVVDGVITGLLLR